MDYVVHLQGEIQLAMKSGNKARLDVLRLLLSAIKQTQIDSKTSLDNAGFIAVVEKMIKQRLESIRQYQAGNRPELAEKEQAEINLLQPFMPEKMSDAEVNTAVDAAIAKTGATSIKDMGKVMGELKTQLAGRTDMAAVSQQIRQKLVAN